MAEYVGRTFENIAGKNVCGPNPVYAVNGW
jgi:hypothetical protein